MQICKSYWRIPANGRPCQSGRASVAACLSEIAGPYLGGRCALTLLGQSQLAVYFYIIISPILFIRSRTGHSSQHAPRRYDFTYITFRAQGKADCGGPELQVHSAVSAVNFAWCGDLDR